MSYLYNKRIKFLDKYLIISLFLIISFLSSILLFKTHILFGSFDLDFHIRRILELEKSLSQGKILPSYSFNEFHGAASMLMYPSLNLLPIAIAHIFIKSNVTLIYLFIDFNEFISLCASFYSSKYFTKSNTTSIIFSIIYSISNSFLFQSFYNMDLGALTAMAVLPLVIFGFLKLISTGYYIEFVIGQSLIIYSHVLCTIIISLILILILFMNIPKLNKYIMYSLLRALIIIVLLTSIIWMPMIHLLIYNIGNINPPFLNHMYGVSFESIMYDSIFNQITPYLSLLNIFSVFLSIFFYRKFNRYDKQFLWVSLIVIFCCSNLFPWYITNYGFFKILKIFQFPWRFYIIPQFLLSYLFSKCITQMCTGKLKDILVSLTLILVIIFSIVGQISYIHKSFPTLTSNYMKPRTYISNQKVYLHGKSIKFHVKEFHFTYTNVKKFKNFPFPRYKVGNNKQLNNLANNNNNINSTDYYPINSIFKQNYINDNKGAYGYHLKNIKNIGYNKFAFNNSNYLKSLILPIVYYNGETLRIYLNKHLIPYKINKYGMIVINNIPKHYNSIVIKNDSNNILNIIEVMFFVIGVLWMNISYYYKVK